MPECQWWVSEKFCKHKEANKETQFLSRICRMRNLETSLTAERRLNGKECKNKDPRRQQIPVYIYSVYSCRFFSLLLAFFFLRCLLSVHSSAFVSLAKYLLSVEWRVWRGTRKVFQYYCSSVSCLAVYSCLSLFLCVCVCVPCCGWLAGLCRCVIIVWLLQSLFFLSNIIQGWCRKPTFILCFSFHLTLSLSLSFYNISLILASHYLLPSCLCFCSCPPRFFFFFLPSFAFLPVHLIGLYCTLCIACLPQHLDNGYLSMKCNTRKER